MRRLSSNSTVAVRYGVPAAFALMLMVGPLIHLVMPPELTPANPPPLPAFPPVVELFTSVVKALVIPIWAYAAYVSLQIKDVVLDGDHLILSAWRRSVRVPLQQVESVDQDWWRPRSATILLRRETEFGNRVLFLPMQTALLPWAASPTIQELRELVDHASKRVLERCEAHLETANSDYSPTWRQYFYWRRAFWLVVLTYFPGVFALGSLLKSIVGKTALGEGGAFGMAWGIWMVAWFVTVMKLRKWLCPHCRTPFFETRFGFPLPHIMVRSCRNCGLPKGAATLPSSTALHGR